ncbi:MAG: hypothetical protein ABI873_11775 [Marmoricola sp.]
MSASITGPPAIRFSELESIGDCPCLAETMMVVVASWWVRRSTVVIVPISWSTYARAPRSSGPGVVPEASYPPAWPSEVGSFSAVETDWKFIP